MDWNLDEIVKLSEFDKQIKAALTRIKKLEKMLKTLVVDMSVEKFKTIVEYDEDLGEKIGRLYKRAYLMETSDQKNMAARVLKGKAMDLYIEYDRVSKKLGHWIKGLNKDNYLDDKNAKRLFTSIKDLKYNFNYAREGAKYNLSEREEEIVTNKDAAGIEVINDLRELIENEFEYKIVDKNYKSQDEVTALFQSDKKEIREEAYRVFLGVHQKNIDKFFLSYRAAVKNWSFEAKFRGFKSEIAMRNFGNQIPDKTIGLVMETTRENKNIFENYFKYKAKALGQKKLKRFDIYAPLEGIKKERSFDESKKLVLESFFDFSERFGMTAKKLFENGHIDKYPRQGKSSGAFCLTIGPKTSPFVMLNHTGKENDIYTMAHELGHGIHDLYANGHYPSVQHASLPLAETASTIGEMIVFEKILENEKDETKKRAIVARKMADSYATILRQNYFVLFEIRAHQALKKGVGSEELGEMWMETLKEQFGESVEIDPIFKYEWSYISHIAENPFYCYAYNFGELLSFALFAKYKNEGKAYVKKVEEILTAGGSEEPRKILLKAGIDINKKDVWRGAFGLIKAWGNGLNA